MSLRPQGAYGGQRANTGAPTSSPLTSNFNFQPNVQTGGAAPGGIPDWRNAMARQFQVAPPSYRPMSLPNLSMTPPINIAQQVKQTKAATPSPASGINKWGQTYQNFAPMAELNMASPYAPAQYDVFVGANGVPLMVNIGDAQSYRQAPLQDPYSNGNGIDK